MEVKNCKDCGRLFNYLSGPRLCVACRQKLEDKFNEVRTYVRDNPNIGMQQLAEDMEVSIAQIRQWVREERLIFSPDSMVTIDCENCGAPIRTGRFCDNCKDSLTKQFGGLYKTETQVKKQTKDGNKMRFLD